jgi:23S rRNA (pseudouridine1915-N3)-methyltransferase
VEDRKKAKGEHTAAQLEREAQEIERRINAPGRFVLLDERGVQMSSMEVADLVEQWLNRSVPDVTFLVGGFRGIPDRVKDLADLRWSLSKLTLQHELARVVLLEQIYRAVSIVKGLPYHR